MTPTVSVVTPLPQVTLTTAGERSAQRRDHDTDYGDVLHTTARCTMALRTTALRTMALLTLALSTMALLTLALRTTARRTMALRFRKYRWMTVTQVQTVLIVLIFV